MVDTVKISELPASQTINNVSGKQEYKATGDVELNPGSGFIIQTNNAQLIQTSTSSGVAVQRIKLNGDLNYRFGWSGDGICVWGSGSAPEDTYLSRTGAKTLNLRGVSSTDAILAVTGSIFGSVGIAAGTLSLNASAILQADSTTQGFLPPRMTTTQRDAIVLPATGLVIYNTTNLALETYDGTGWEQGDGNVTGPASATDNAFALYNGTTGKIIKNSNLTYASNVIATTSGDIGINAFTTFVRFNSNTLTGIATAVGTALDFTSLINTNIVGTTTLTIGSAVDDLRLSVGTGKSVDFLNNPAVNIYSAAFKGAPNGATILSTRYTTDTGNRFYIENSGNHFWCSVGNGTITHAFTVDAAVDGNFVLSDSGGTAGRLTCITEILTNQIKGTSNNNLVLTTNNSANLVEITRIPIMSSLSATVSAFAGGGQASATVLTSYYNAVTTVASDGDSVKLDTIANMPVGSVIIIKNCTATNTLNIYPDSGSQFFYTTLQSVDTSIGLAPGNSLTAYRRTLTIWDGI